MDICHLMNADLLQWRSCEHGTLVSNSSFCESALRLCNCNRLILSIRFDRWRKERVCIPLDNWVLPMVKTEEAEMLVSPPNLTPGNRMQGNMSFPVLEKKIQMTQLGEKGYSNILWQLEIASKFVRMRTTDGEHLLLCAENIRVPDLIRKPQLWQLFPQVQLSDQFWKFILWRFTTDMR